VFFPHANEVRRGLHVAVFHTQGSKNWRGCLTDNNILKEKKAFFCTVKAGDWPLIGQHILDSDQLYDGVQYNSTEPQQL
jgi:hypothetical protein